MFSIINKKLIKIIGIALLVFILSATTYSLLNKASKKPKLNISVRTKTPINKNSRKVIGVCVMNYVNDYWNDLVDGVKAYAKEADFDVIAVQVNDSVDEQVHSINDFIKKDVDGIIVAAINETLLEPEIEKAMNKGIKVIAHLHDLKEFNVLYGAKEYEMGFTAGRYMGKLLKDKGVTNPRLAMLTYPNLETLIDREKGMEDGLREFVPETIIIAKEQGDKPSSGKTSALKIIKQNPNINGFMGINDNGLMGALAASKEMGIASRDDFFIVGIGGDKETLNLIESETAFKATVNTDPWLNGYNEAKIMEEMFNGKNYSQKRVFFSPMIVIDKTNVSELISEKERRRKLLEK